jgi:serine/threonine-protein kinase RsbW
MQRGRPVPRGGEPESAAACADPGSEVAVLRARCRRQTLVIERLRDAVSVLRSGVGALKAENADLRSQNDRFRDERDADDDEHQAPDPRRLEARVPMDVCAPAASRVLVGDWLSGRVSPLTVERAQLVVSELVGNSLRHAGAAADRVVVVRVALEGALCRLEVEDAGCDGEIAPRAPDLKGGGGLGLNIVHKLSERWGIERAAGKGTRVWAYLAPARRERGQRPLEVVRVAADV